MAALTTRKIEAIVHTKIDAARRRTVAKTIALDRLSAFLGDAAPALQPPALPWVDLEIRPAFREPVEICVDCPEKATNGPAFKVRFAASPEVPSWLVLSARWRHRDDVASMACSGRETCRVDGVNVSTQVLVLLEPEEVSRAAQRTKAGDFDLVLGHDAAAVAAARGRASAPFAHGGTWVPRDVWAAPPRRKAPKASLVCGALPRPNYTKLVSRGDGVVLSIFEIVGTSTRWRSDDAKKRRRQGPDARPPCQKSGLGRRRGRRSHRALRLRTFKATA